MPEQRCSGEVEVLREGFVDTTVGLDEVLGHLVLPPRVDLFRSHRLLHGLDVIGLEVTDDHAVLWAQEQGVIAPPGASQGITYLLLYVLMDLDVLGQPLGAHVEQEAAASRGTC